MIRALPFLLALAGPSTAAQDDNPIGPVVGAQRIWNRAPHCAFGDLIRWNDRFLCVLREASAHVPGTNGVVRVLTSDDGADWRSIALLVEDGIDLRDPKLATMPDGSLMLSCGGSDYSDGLQEWHTRVAFSKDGQSWTPPRRVRGIPPTNWFFRLTWHEGVGYCMPFVCGADPTTGRVLRDQRILSLYCTTDGFNYTAVSGPLALGPTACEASLRFDADDNLHAVVRLAGGESTRGAVVHAAPPYTEFQTHTIEHGLGGPNSLLLPDDSLLVGTREVEAQRPEGREGSATVLLRVEASGQYQRVLEFESGGDTSYPGMLVHEGTLWVMYYSSHQGNAAMYLAKLSWEHTVELALGKKAP